MKERKKQGNKAIQHVIIKEKKGEKIEKEYKRKKERKKDWREN